MLLISGCAHNSAEFKQSEIADDGRALLYIYRPVQFSNAILSPTAVIDGEAVFDTHSGAYTYLYLAAGTHRFVLESEQRILGNDEVEFQLQGGQVWYLRIDTALQFETGRPYTRSFSIVRVDEPTAMSEITHCRPQQTGLPSKYLWSVEARGTAADDVPADAPAIFTIDKSSNPFGAKQPHE